MIIELAKLKININGVSDNFRFFCQDYVSDGEPDFSVTINSTDIENEKIFFENELKFEGLNVYDASQFQLEHLAVFRKIAEMLPKYDAVVFHSAVVGYKDNGYIFTAKSGTGKTTHVKLWMKNINGCLVISGDKPIIRKIDSQFFVFGTPWMGKEKYGSNSFSKIKAVVCLNRAENNYIEKTSITEVYPLLLQQSYRSANAENLCKTMCLIKELGTNVDLFKLYCNMDDEAALKAFEVIVK